MKLFRRLIVTTIVLLTALPLMAANSKISETVLPNGLTVLIKEVHSAPVFTAQVWYKVGSRNEHTGITGISHLVEHMMFKGTKTHGVGQFSSIIKSKGGMENAATWIDYTNYWELMSSDNLELALSLEADRMQNANFDTKEFKSERIVVRSELEGRENDPDSLLYQNMFSQAYRVHPYRWPTIGWTSDVENVSRDQLYKYYKTYYHPSNATLVIVGDVNTKKALELAQKHFGKIPAGPKPPKVYTTEPQQTGERRFVLNREGSAHRVMMAWHIPDINNPDVYPLMVLDQIMSGGNSSRIYQALVETQQATSAWSNAGITRDPGLFMVGATGREGVTAQQLEASLLQQVGTAVNTIPTENEMTRAKNQLEAYLVFQNDSVSDQGEQIGYYNTVATWKYLENLLPNIKKVTAADVQRVARKYLTQDNRTTGWFVPTGPPAGGSESGAPAGAVHFEPRKRMEAYYTGKPTPAAAKTAVVKQAQTKSSLVKPTRVQLDNGMVVIVQENRSNPTVAITGSIKAGGYFDPNDKKGLASFTAEMLSRGTTSRSALEIARQTDFVGASVETSADTEAARFSGKGLSKNFNLLVDVIADELRNPSFAPDQIARVKGQMTSQLAQEKEDPEKTAERAFYRAIFPAGHPYRLQTVEETQKSISSLTRDDLVAFHSNYYGPQSAIIVIVGDVDTQSAISTVRKYFDDWKRTSGPTTISIPDIPVASSPSKVVIPMMDKSQVNAAIGNAGLLKRTDPDFYAANVMNTILGGGSGLDSRLAKRVRGQLGLVYSVYSYFDAAQGAGPWMVTFGTNPANVDKSVATVHEQMNQYLKTGPTKKEFTEAIDYITGVFPIRLETNSGVANVLLGAETYGLGMDYIQKYPSIYRSVTLAQVREAAKKHLHPDKTVTVIAGPYPVK